MKQIWPIKLCLITTLIVNSCGDSLLGGKHIVGKYYLFQNETSKGVGLFYEIGGNAIVGRVSDNILEYAIMDSLLVVKTDSSKYYIINMLKDNQYAKEIDYLVGVESEEEFSRKWCSHNIPNFLSAK